MSTTNSTNRLYYLDNLKVFLTVLVVCKRFCFPHTVSKRRMIR